MSLMKRLGMVAVATVLGVASMAPTCAQAWNGRMPEAEVVGGFSWGPSPPYYPYYHFGSYGVPVGWHVPFAGPGVYGCHREEVWTGRHWRRVRVCD